MDVMTVPPSPVPTHAMSSEAAVGAVGYASATDVPVPTADAHACTSAMAIYVVTTVAPTVPTVVVASNVPRTGFPRINTQISEPNEMNGSNPGPV